MTSNATSPTTTQHSPRTFWNRGLGKTERRVFRNHHWVRPDPQAAKTLAWLKGGGK